jgi:hypothetical protein
MKKLFFVLTAAGLLLGASSCSKSCGACNASGQTGTTVCTSDPGGQTYYDLSKSICLNAGGNWVAR